MLRRIARGVSCASLMLLLVPAAAGAAAFGDRPLRMGMHGKDVRVLQSLLTQAGFPTAVHGHYGRRTRRSAARWEASRERTVDGRMSRADQLALRLEFDGPISLPGPEVDALADGGAGTGFARLVRLGEAAPGGTVESGPADLHARVFPIGGEHDLGRNEANRFGGGRGHMGQDMFADCGTPVLAAQAGRVVFAGYHAAAGNYLVIRGTESREDFVYMHLSGPGRVGEGDRVEMGERIGSVGRSGRADGCHLHFELWSEPGWYRGGSPRDPLPALRRWDAWS